VAGVWGVDRPAYQVAGEGGGGQPTMAMNSVENTMSTKLFAEAFADGAPHGAAAAWVGWSAAAEDGDRDVGVEQV